MLALSASFRTRRENGRAELVNGQFMRGARSGLNTESWDVHSQVALVWPCGTNFSVRPRARAVKGGKDGGAAHVVNGHRIRLLNTLVRMFAVSTLV